MLKKRKSERLIWIDITFTLSALFVMAYFSYGIRIILLGGICIAVSLAAELVSMRLMHRKFTADNLSCTSDAMITALMMPAVIDYKIPAIACLFSVIAAKNIFGGRKNMIFSPSAVAYVFILVSWKKELLSYSLPNVKTGISEKAEGLVSSVSHTFNHTGTVSQSDFELLLGNFSGPVGAVSILLLLVAAVILIFRRDISAGAFIGTIFGTILLACLCPVSGWGIESVKYTLATNMVLFAAIYIVSDVRIAPKKNYYAFFYGLFIAFTAYILMLTTGKENTIVILSVLFTPFALGFKLIEGKIDAALTEEMENAAQTETVMSECTAVESAEEQNEGETSAEEISPENTASDNAEEASEASRDEEISDFDEALTEEGESAEETSSDDTENVETKGDEAHE